MQSTGKGGHYPSAMKSMKNMKKRILSMLLAVVMLSVLVPIAASAATVVDSGTCGDNVTWTLDSAGTLTISGTGEMRNGNWDAPWYSHIEDIKSAIIESGVTSIGDFAFCGCSSLVSITIPNSVTSIGDGAFYGCSSLPSITIPNSVTSIGWSAFEGCSSLPSITIPDSVTSIEYGAFCDCSRLMSITIPDSVTSIGSGAFYNTAWLNNQNDGPIYVGRVLYEYKGTVPGNTSFKIKDGTKVICSSAFYNQTGLTKITMPDSVKTIGDYAFMECSNLSEIDMSSNIEYIGIDAFFGTEYYNNYPDDVIYLGNWILDCKSDTADGLVSGKHDAALTLTSVTVKDGTVGIAAEAFLPGYMEMYKSVLENVSLPNSIKYICNSAFSSCDSLPSIIIPDSVTSIGEGAFSGCDSLTSITIPNSVTSINYRTFFNCSSLTSVTIGSGVTSIGDGAFEYCSLLTSVTIGSDVTSIGEWAFYGCDSLTDVYYSGNEAEWEAISIGSHNDCLTNATIHYNYKDETAKIKSVTPISSSNGTYKFEVELDNISQSGVLVAAIYKNGVMRGFETANISSGASSPTITVTADAADSARFFVWDSIKTMKPLCAAKSIDI